jgi:hypothetical protein
MTKRGLAICICLWPALLAAVLPLPSGQNGLGFDISGGITFSNGNSNQTIINGGYAFALNQDSLGFQSKLEMYYGRSEGRTHVGTANWNHALLFRLNPLFNLSGSLGFEYDQAAKIGLRSTLNLGIQLILQNSPQNKTNLTLSISGEALNGLEETLDQTSARFTLLMATERAFSETAKFKIDCQLTPNLIDFFHDYRMDLSSSLSVLMKKPLWLTLKVRNRFINIPQSDLIKRNDLTLVTALTLSF